MVALLPADELSQARTLLARWRKRSSCKLKELQSLMQILQFACRVLAPGRTFLRRMINSTCGIKQPYHFVKLNSGFYKDLAMWETILNALGFSVTTSPSFEFKSKDLKKPEDHGAITTNRSMYTATQVYFYRSPCTRNREWHR